MHLKRFIVKQFRSIENSVWIECDDVTTLVGVNEAGKSNILLGLWKLNPATGGEINLLADIPRGIYSTARSEPGEIVFVEAEFILDASSTRKIAEKCFIKNTDGLEIRVKKYFDGSKRVEFLNAISTNSLLPSNLFKNINAKIDIINALPESELKTLLIKNFGEISQLLPDEKAVVNKDKIDKIKKLILEHYYSTQDPLKKEIWAAYIEANSLSQYFDNPANVAGINSLIVGLLPKFVYYENYGNLDSEIYLPQAIESMARKEQSRVAESKARTLKVLFEFVGLDPNEILEMGKEPQYPNPENIAAAAATKAERQALLHSAQSKLSRDFKEWWKQGEYSFDFRADGNYFRIFVSDSERPEPIELENRSTGLQWFLSFYLVFLVESKDAHQNTILLLDEAGHSLHPLAQRDLASFFISLSEKNQIIHTTQSPFLIDTNHVDRVKVVYIDNKGFTVASENLRANESQGKQQRSIYAVHAALGLSISDVLLQGCFPVIVEGTSEQIYFNAIKNWLIRGKHISPGQELLFVPSGGTKGVKPLTSILSAREGELPPVVVDSDIAGLSR